MVRERSEKQLAVTQIRSMIGHPVRTRQVLRGLGLGKLHRTVVRPDTPEIRGMIARVSHLVEVKEV